jgi:hypothetical protein
MKIQVKTKTVYQLSMDEAKKAIIEYLSEKIDVVDLNGKVYIDFSVDTINPTIELIIEHEIEHEPEWLCNAQP